MPKAKIPVGRAEFLQLLKDGSSFEKRDDMELRSGPFSLLYENGNLRDIRANGTEILRMVYSAVRDSIWLTLEPEISDEYFEISKDSFHIHYNARYRNDEIDFEAHYIIEGNQEGTIHCELKGKALNTFFKNRIGFCVLHPPGIFTGKEVIIKHPDGRFTNSYFPENISPFQPFLDIMEMKCRLSDNVSLTIVFSGDTFETEDQRNWTDGSFKTYCTPLSRPYPAQMSEGTTITQEITFFLENKAGNTSTQTHSEQVRLKEFPEKCSKIPVLGISVSGRDIPLTTNEIGILKEVPFGIYRYELNFSNPCWEERIQRAARESEELVYPLEIALMLRHEDIGFIPEFLSFCRQNKIKPAYICLLGADRYLPDESISEKLLELFRCTFPGVKTGYGTSANFAQLNRSRPSKPLADYLVYSIHPQEHATDNRTLAENAEAQKYTVATAKSFSHNMVIYPGPVTLRRRFNANTGYSEPVGFPGYFPGYDRRQFSLFAALWTLASFKHLSESGAGFVAYYETAGINGIIAGDELSNYVSNGFPVPGMISPVFALMKFILHIENARIYYVSSDNLTETDAFGIENPLNAYLIVYNFSRKDKKIILGQKTGSEEILLADADYYYLHMNSTNWFEEKDYFPAPADIWLPELSFAIIRRKK